MARNDPTDTGGLFIGRRPGHGARARAAPAGARQRAAASASTAARRAASSRSRRCCASACFGPAAAGLALGRLAGRVPDRLRDARASPRSARHAGLADAHAGAGQAARPRLEARAPRRRPRAGARRARADLRRHAGDRRGRPSASGSSSSRAPARRWPRRTSPRLGLLDYYRQFEDIDEEELNKVLRARRAREKALALEQVPDARPVRHRVAGLPQLRGHERLDLHRARARERLPRPPRRATSAACWPSATGSSPSRSWSATARPSCCRPRRYALLGAGDELVTPWPSYPLYPLMAARAGGRAGGGRRRRRGDLRGARSPSAPGCWCSATPTTRPATTSPPSRSPRSPSQLPEHVHVLVDEALVHFQDVEPVDAVLRLVDALPAAARVPHVLEDLRALGAARRLRGRLERLDRAARRDRARAGRQRAHPGGGRPGAEDRRPRGRAPPRLGDPRARPPDGGAAHDLPRGRHADSQANFVWLQRAAACAATSWPTACDERGRDRGAGRPAGRGRPRAGHRCATTAATEPRC